MKICERLSAHTHTLPPLKVGDTVRIQNQTGPHPTKWDKTGIVVEVRQFDQYVIRVDGSGRVTLRNRKFLRQYHPVIARNPITMLPEPTPKVSHVLPKPIEAAEATPGPKSQNTPHPKTVSNDVSTAPQEHFDTTPPTIETELTPMTPTHLREKPSVIPRALRALMPYNKPGLKETEPLPERRPRKTIP